MIYLLHGNDRDKARKKMTELVAALQAKKPDLSLVKITDETWNADDLPSLIGSQGLFERKMLVQAEYLIGKGGKTGNKSAGREVILENLGDIAATENIFIFLEEELDAPTHKKFEAKAHKIQQFSKPDVPEPRADFNVFALTDALGRRDKKGLWVLYQEALAKDMQPEEVHGLLFWQVKNMLLSSEKGATAASTGLSPFPFKKAQEFSANFTRTELEFLSFNLVSIFHEARASGPELSSALERLILEL